MFDVPLSTVYVRGMCASSCSAEKDRQAASGVQSSAYSFSMGHTGSFLLADGGKKSARTHLGRNISASSSYADFVVEALKKDAVMALRSIEDEVGRCTITTS